MIFGRHKKLYYPNQMRVKLHFMRVLQEDIICIIISPSLIINTSYNIIVNIKTSPQLICKWLFYLLHWFIHKINQKDAPPLLPSFVLITKLSSISNTTINSSFACEITTICDNDFNNVGFKQNLILVNHANKFKIRKI